MKTIRNSLFSFAVIILIGKTCTKESEETMDEDESYVESMYGEKKEVVQADWKKFMPLAHNMISISESNLKSIRVKISNTNDGDRKIKWNMAYQQGEYKLGQLKEKLERRNLQFMDELKDYDGTSGKTNTDFKNTFLREIVELNKTLEEIIDE